MGKPAILSTSMRMRICINTKYVYVEKTLRIACQNTWPHVCQIILYSRKLYTKLWLFLKCVTYTDIAVHETPITSVHIPRLIYLKTAYTSLPLWQWLTTYAIINEVCRQIRSVAFSMCCFFIIVATCAYLNRPPWTTYLCNEVKWRWINLETYIYISHMRW